MSYRRAENLDKNLVFSEYFNSEQEVRRNGGVPTGDMDFSQAKVSIYNSLDNNCINWDLEKSSGDRSVRIRFKLNSSSTSGYRYFLMARNIDNTSSTVLARIDDATNIMNANTLSGTLYLNGNAYTNSTQVAEVDVWYDMIAVFSDIAFSKFAINVDANNGNNNSDFTYDIVEIYNKALAAEEVSNLYNDARYAMPNLEHGEQLGGDLIAPLDFTINWGAIPDATIVDSNNFLCGTFDYIRRSSVLEIGKHYQCHIKGSTDCTSFRVYQGGIGYQISPTYPLGSFDDTFYFISVAKDISLRGADATNQNTYIEEFSIEEVVVEDTSKILHVTAKDGVILDKLGNAITKNGIEVVKDGQIRAMRFENNLANYLTTSVSHENRNISFMCWAKIPINASRGAMIGHNSKTGYQRLLFEYAENTNISIWAGSGSAQESISVTTAGNLKDWNHFGFTIDSEGNGIIYLNGEAVATGSFTLDSSESEFCITPNAGGYRELIGDISDWCVLEGVLTAIEFSQTYTSTKHLYNK